MATARFVVVSDRRRYKCIFRTTREREHQKKKKKTLYDLKIFREFLESCGEKREIEDVTPVELQAIFKKLCLL